MVGAIMKTDKKILQSRASPELIAAVDAIAKVRFNGSHSAVVREAVQTYVDNFATACREVDDPIRMEILYLREVLLQSARADPLIKEEVERLWKMIQKS